MTTTAAGQAKKVPTSPATQPQPGNNKILQYVCLALAAIPLFIYLHTISLYALNFPYCDDYDAILGFLNQYTDADFQGKLSLLFSQHGEHRIFHARLIYVLYHKLFGEINFVSLIWLGNLQYVAIFGLLTVFMKKAIPQWWYIGTLISSICMFDLSNGENANFAMAGMSNYGVVMLFFIAMWLFAKGTRATFVAGLFFEALTIFSNGNGTIAALFLVVFLVLTKRRKEALIAGILFAGCVAAYFLTLHEAPPSGDGPTNLMRMTTYLVYLSGAHFGFDYLYNNSLEWGLASIAFFVVVLLYRPKALFRPGNEALICVCLFLLGSMASIAVFRSGVADIKNLSHSGRYLMYPHMLMGIMFVFLLAKLDTAPRKVVLSFSTVFVLAMAASYQYNADCGERGFIIANKRLRFSDYFYGWSDTTKQKHAAAIEKEACIKGIYCISNER